MNSLAIILAAGKSTRLRPITSLKPKSRLMVNGCSNLSRTVKLLMNHIDHFVIVTGKNFNHLKEDLAWVESGLVRFDSERQVSDLGCAASLKNGLSYVTENVDDVFLIEADVVFSREAINRAISTMANTATLTTNQVKPDDGKVFFSSSDSHYYIMKERNCASDKGFGKFVGLTKLTGASAMRLYEMIPDKSEDCCSDFVQKMLTDKSEIIEVDSSIIGELDTPDDYLEVLRNPNFEAIDLGLRQDLVKALSSSKMMRRFSTTKTIEDVVQTQQNGFDGAWYIALEVADALDFLTGLGRRRKQAYTLPVVIDFTHALGSPEEFRSVFRKKDALGEIFCINMDQSHLLGEVPSFHEESIIFRGTENRFLLADVSRNREKMPNAEEIVVDFVAANTDDLLGLASKVSLAIYNNPCELMDAVVEKVTDRMSTYGYVHETFITELLEAKMNFFLRVGNDKKN